MRDSSRKVKRKNARGRIQMMKLLEHRAVRFITCRIVFLNIYDYFFRS